MLISDYILVFDGDEGSYSSVQIADNSFNALSVSLWVKTTDRTNIGTLFSYANYEHGNAFTLSDDNG